IKAGPDKYTKSSFAISPWHDFDLADEKLFTSLTLSCEALPADWTVYVDYAKNGSTSWTNVITYTTDGGTGTRTNVSTDSSTIEFQTLSIRIRMVYDGAGIPTTYPVVLGIDVRAMVVQHVKTWTLLMSLSDDKSGNQGHSGARKTTNIKTAGALGMVLDFKDGYVSHVPGVYTQHDVVIDSYSIVGSTPGEGVVQVVLKEIS
ncbi:MAG: hypothetical protein L0Y56_00925, partial [Nitrospira sp.]|nr:hypothetical protein [Nitrospira sp.]